MILFYCKVKCKASPSKSTYCACHFMNPTCINLTEEQHAKYRNKEGKFPKKNHELLHTVLDPILNCDHDIDT